MRAIESAVEASDLANVNPVFIVFDDGSTDGTAAVLSRLDADVSIIRGDGSAFWAKSMAIAERHALARTDLNDDDILVWLNDDVVLFPETLGAALKYALQNPSAITVGAMCEPSNGSTSYSGFVRSGRHPMSFARVDPGQSPQRVDTFNGNFVLVPVRVAKMMGGIDGAFSHGLADIDYGLRANAVGTSVVLCPIYLGECARNGDGPRPSVRAAWKAHLGPKGGGNLRSNVRFLRRHGGRWWFLYLVSSYILWWIRAGGSLMGWEGSSRAREDLGADERTSDWNRGSGDTPRI